MMNPIDYLRNLHDRATHDSMRHDGEEYVLYSNEEIDNDEEMVRNIEPRINRIRRRTPRLTA